MRYTTVIDITEMPEIYRNVTARLVYVHLSLKAGYHDADRDLAAVSIRRLAGDVGCTVSAIRHALKQLERHQLVTREGNAWRVKKWVEEQKITTRARTKRELQDQLQALERQRQQEIQELKSMERHQYDPATATDNEAFRNIQRRFGLTKKDTE